MKPLMSTVFLSLVLVGCSGSPEADPSQGQGIVLWRWTAGQTGTATFYSSASGEIAAASISAAGQMSYSLPVPPQLSPVPAPGAGCSLEVAPANGRRVSLQIEVQVSGASSSGWINIASIDPTASTTGVGDLLEAQLVYFEGDWSAAGTCVTGSLTRFYDIKAKPGWNFILSTTKAISPAGQATELRLTAARTLPRTARWYYIGPSAVTSLATQPGQQNKPLQWPL